MASSPAPAYSYSVPRSLSSASLSSSSATDDSLHNRLVASLSLSLCPPRRQDSQHLAVLIPRSLWKSDRDADRCDSFHCRVPFPWFGKRHHCRACGGVFCQDCSSQQTTLLDTSSLPFNYPPQNTPVELYATRENPMRLLRVCDDCFETLHGSLPFRQQQLRAKSALVCESLAPSTPKRRSRPKAAKPCPAAMPTVDPVYAGYPLAVPSAICKANGGGRWRPDPLPVRWDLRPSGDKTLWEIELDKRRDERRQRKENPFLAETGYPVMTGLAKHSRPKLHRLNTCS